MKIRPTLLAALAALPLICSAAEPPKRLLVVGATAAFRLRWSPCIGQRIG
jgi:hypothetical protein